MKPHILVIEDDADIADMLRRGLIYKGYSVETADSGEAGLDQATRLPPDLVILDLMLPDMDGIEACRRLRAASEVTVIILTARDAVSDRVLGLDSGADDYVTKPFAFDELLARVRAVLRRRAPKGESPIRVGDLVIDPRSREVSRSGRPISLTAREYDLLEFLARHAGQVLSKETLFEKVWGYDFEIESEAVKVYVSHLRDKLNAPGAPDLIHTVRGVGYMLKG